MKEMALVVIMTIGFFSCLCEGASVEGQITDVQSPTEIVIGEMPVILSNVSSGDLAEVETFKEELVALEERKI